MVTFNYYDDDGEQAKSHAQRLTDEELNLIIIDKQPKEMEVIIPEIKKDFSEKKIDGIIFDLRFEEKPVNGKKLLYRGTALAQELRTESSEDGNLNLDFPIVLLSSETNLLRYNSDYSSHDLFDLVLSKDKYNINSDNIKVIKKRIVSLANGYKLIKENKNVNLIHKIIGLPKDDVSLIYPKFIYSLQQLIDKPIHVIARFLKNKLVEPQGLLIERDVLMARLGIDEANSNPESIKELFENRLNSFKYSGTFSEGWERYWMDLVSRWWDEEVNSHKPINAFPASKRVEQITEKTKISGLKVANPIKAGFSEYFWTVCILSRKPLDPINGFITISQYDPINKFPLMAENSEPWLDKNYVTKDEYFKKSSIIKLVLDSNDAKLIEEG